MITNPSVAKRASLPRVLCSICGEWRVKGAMPRHQASKECRHLANEREANDIVEEFHRHGFTAAGGNRKKLLDDAGIETLEGTVNWSRVEEKFVSTIYAPEWAYLWLNRTMGIHRPARLRVLRAASTEEGRKILELSWDMVDRDSTTKDADIYRKRGVADVAKGILAEESEDTPTPAGSPPSVPIEKGSPPNQKGAIMAKPNTKPDAKPDAKPDKPKVPVHLKSVAVLEKLAERIKATAEKWRQRAARSGEEHADTINEAAAAFCDGVDEILNGCRLLQELPNDWKPRRAAGGGRTRKTVEAGDSANIRERYLDAYEDLIEAADVVSIKAIRGKQAECLLGEDRIFIPLSHLKKVAAAPAE